MATVSTAIETESSPPSTPAGGAPSLPAPPVVTDGRQLRRERNREAVVEALLDLYSEGNLQPSAEEIATRSGLSPRSLFRYFDDVDDLVRAAIDRQKERAIPLLPIDATPDASLEVRVSALIDQRFRLFGAVGNAAAVSRLRAPFQPLLATELSQNRAFLRSQIEVLFAPELAAMEPAVAVRALAATDVLASFEARALLSHDQGFDTAQAKAVMAEAIGSILGRRR
jgi:AcrR family transcriptional regulator